MGWRWRWGRPRAYECLTSFRTLPAACIENGGLNVRRSKQHNTHETVPPHSVSSLVAILVARGTGARGAHRHPYLQKQVVRGTGASRQTQRQNQKETVQKPQNSGYNSQSTGTGHGARGTGHGARGTGHGARGALLWAGGGCGLRAGVGGGLGRGAAPLGLRLGPRARGPLGAGGGRGRGVGRGQGVRPTPTMLALSHRTTSFMPCVHVCRRCQSQDVGLGWGGSGREVYPGEGGVPRPERGGEGHQVAQSHSSVS